MRPLLAATGIALAVAFGLPSPAGAQMRGIDRVYADPFGNLVIHGSTGYKRIVVGEGRSADQFAQAAGPAGPVGPVGPAGPGASPLGQQAQAADPYCFTPPTLVWGRSYMYGFHDGLIPQIGRICR